MLPALLPILRLEAYRLFMTKQGRFFMVAFILIWCLLLRFVLMKAALWVDEYRINLNKQTSNYWVIYQYMSLALFPIFCIIMGAGQTGSDRSRGTLRFMSLHTTRGAIFFGRFIAQVLIQWGFLLISFISALLVFCITDSFTWHQLGQGLIFLANLSLCLLPFIALMSMLSAKVDSARKASLLAFLIWFFALAIVSLISHYFAFLAPIKLIVPGMQFDDLRQLTGFAQFKLVYIPVIQTLVFLTLGHFFMKRAAI